MYEISVLDLYSPTGVQSSEDGPFAMCFYSQSCNTMRVRNRKNTPTSCYTDVDYRGGLTGSWTGCDLKTGAVLQDCIPFVFELHTAYT